MTSARLSVVALVALTLAALVVRVRGIDHGLPVALEQDCKIPRQVELLREDGDRWLRDSEMRWYPLLVATVARLWPEAQPAPVDALLAEHLRAAAKPHVQTRLTVTLLALFLVPATWWLARRFVGDAWALFAAALSAFSLLHVNFSQQSRPHAVAGALFTLAIVAALRMRMRASTANVALAALAAALSIGCLQSGLAVLPAAAVAWFLRESPQRRWLDARVLVFALALVAAALAFYPFAIFGEDSAREVSGRVAKSFVELHFSPKFELDIGDHRFFLDQLAGGGAPIVARTLWSYEPVLLALLALALAMLFARGRARYGEQRPPRGDLWVVLAFAIPYGLVALLYERTYERFVIPLLPYCACAAAFGVRELARKLRMSSIVSVATCCALLALPAYATWRLGSIRGAPHTTTEAAAWAAEHASEDVALWPQLDLPLAREPAGLTSWMGAPENAFFWPWVRYQARLAEGHAPPPLYRLRWWEPKLKQMVDDPAEYARTSGGDWIVLEVYDENRVHPGATRVREHIAATCELALRISPDGDPRFSEHPLGYQDETSVAPPNFLARVLRARTSGPVIEIYRLMPR